MSPEVGESFVQRLEALGVERRAAAVTAKRTYKYNLAVRGLGLIVLVPVLIACCVLAVAIFVATVAAAYIFSGPTAAVIVAVVFIAVSTHGLLWGKKK